MLPSSRTGTGKKTKQCILSTKHGGALYFIYFFNQYIGGDILTRFEYWEGMCPLKYIL